ncbi:polysulfide reductase NrfD, partial [bacterium]|nr:polysulfide reductase NrfD [bacterium]
NLITLQHFDHMNKIIMATGMIVGYAYAMAFFIAWYGGNPLETFTFENRATGPYAWAYWIMVTCNVFIPQVFWFKKARTNLWVMWIVSVFVNIGMWFERFVIVVSSLSRDFLPSSWDYYTPTWVDLCTLAGSFGLFFFFFLLFCRYMPIVAIAEVKGVLPEAHPGHGAHAAAEAKA